MHLTDEQFAELKSMYGDHLQRLEAQYTHHLRTERAMYQQHLCDSLNAQSRRNTLNDMRREFRSNIET